MMKMILALLVTLPVYASYLPMTMNGERLTALESTSAVKTGKGKYALPGDGNLLINPGFEHETITSGWVLSCTDDTIGIATPDSSAGRPSHFGKKTLNLEVMGMDTGGTCVFYQDAETGGAFDYMHSIWAKADKAGKAKVLYRKNEAFVTGSGNELDMSLDWKRYKFQRVSGSTHAGIGIEVTVGVGETVNVALDEGFVGVHDPVSEQAAPESGLVMEAAGTVVLGNNTSNISIPEALLAPDKKYMKMEYVATRDVDESGITWTARSAPEANSWSSVTYGNGLFVATSITGTNRVMTSPDGITWTARSAPEANQWRSVTYGNGLFVAVSASGTNRVMTSPDGINWTARSAPEANSWRSVTYGNGLFVAVSASGTYRVMTSPDGITWTARSASEANSWYSVTYGNGLFVAVSYNGTNRVMTSPDGINWTARTAAEANQWYAVTYGNGLFVAVSYDGTNRVMTSPDGINWTARSASEANSWHSVTYGNGLFVATSISGTNRVMTSPDGITWTARTAAEANQWYAVTYGNGLFVAVSATGTNLVMTSPLVKSYYAVSGEVVIHRKGTGFIFTPVRATGDTTTFSIDNLNGQLRYTTSDITPQNFETSELRYKITQM